MGWYDIFTPDNVLVGRFPTRTLDGRYWFLHSDLSEPLEAEGSDSVEIRALGAGGFGAVVCAHDRIQVVRAVKLVDPRRLAAATHVHSSQCYTPGYTPTPEDAETIGQRLEEEIRHANASPFKHVVPIIDYAEVEDARGVRLSYYVSPFIGGVHLDGYFRQLTDNLDGSVRRDRSMCLRLHDLLLALIDDFLAALVELADAGVSHIDVKPANTMVLRAGRPGHSEDADDLRDRLFVIDLGAAVSKRATGTARRFLITTPYFFPEEVLADLEYSPLDGRVSAAKLILYGPVIDLYSTGRSLELLFLDRVRRRSPNFVPTALLTNTEPAKETLWRALLAEDFDVLEGFVDRLLSPQSGFSSPREAQQAFLSVSRHVSRSILSSAALTDRVAGLVINVGGTLVRVASPFDRVVNHPIYQRLRRLNQLALISEQFPDATHTRFSHSLRVYELVKRYVLALNRDPQFRLLCAHKDVDQILAAALVHDIGQYPFSHTIEDLRKLGDLCGVDYLHEIRHDQEVAKDYLQREAPNSIGSIFEEAGYNVADIVYMIQKTPKKKEERPALNIGRDLISGVIDVDRISYLQQDSERTGVRFGGALNPDSLGEALCIYPGAPGVAIEERGISAVEAVLATVYWMYRDVYWKPANRGFMAAVKHVMERLLERRELTFQAYLEACYGNGDWEALRFLDQRFRAMCDRDRLDWHAPLRSIVDQQRYSYTRVFSLGHDTGEAGDLYDGLIGLASPTMLRDLVRRIEGELPTSAGVKFGEVLVDLPLKKRLRSASATAGADGETTAEAGSRPTLMVRKKRRFSRKGVAWVDLYESSPLARSLGKIEDHSGRKVRVFFAAGLLNRLPGNVRDQLADIVLDVVRDTVSKQAINIVHSTPRPTAGGQP